MLDTMLKENKYKLLWYLPILLSPLYWPWIMFIMAILVGLAQGYLTSLKWSANKTIAIAKNPKRVEPIMGIILTIVVIFSIMTLVWFTISCTAENCTNDVNVYLNLKYVTIGVLWSLLIEAFYITAFARYALKKVRI